VLLPSEDLRRAVEELLPTLPAEVGGGPVTAVTRGLRWVALSADAPPRMALRVLLQARDAPSAVALQGLGGKVFQALGEDRDVRQLVPDFDRLTRLLIPTVREDRLSLKLEEPQLTTLFLPLVAEVQRAALRAVAANNLKQIGTALHNYHDVYRVFPAPASYDSQGQPLLSWRVHLLPFLDEENLYRQFRLSEPWDSEHNKKLIPLMPRVYAPPGPAPRSQGKTVYLAPRGKDTMWPGGKGVRIQDVPDGTSNTIFLVEAAADRGVAWTRPDDLTIDPKQPQQGLGSSPIGTFHALFVDGSVHLLRASLPAETLRALFTRNGGEAVTIP
jgi:hypothetical protein